MSNINLFHLWTASFSFYYQTNSEVNIHPHPSISASLTLTSSVLKSEKKCVLATKIINNQIVDNVHRPWNYKRNYLIEIRLIGFMSQEGTCAGSCSVSSERAEPYKLSFRTHSAGRRQEQQQQQQQYKLLNVVVCRRTLHHLCGLPFFFLAGDKRIRSMHWMFFSSASLWFPAVSQLWKCSFNYTWLF